MESFCFIIKVIGHFTIVFADDAPDAFHAKTMPRLSLLARDEFPIFIKRGAAARVD